MLKKIAQTLPINRFMAYVALLGFLPLLFIPFDYSSKSKELRQREAFFQEVASALHLKEEKQALNSCVREAFAHASPHYLEQKLTSLPLLQREKTSLEKMMQNSSFPGGSANEERYHFLTGEDNRLHFKTTHHISKENIEESVEGLDHPVEGDGEDLKKILFLIEERQSGAPELLITDFRLNKKIIPHKNDVYEINLQLLKREFPS